MRKKPLGKWISILYRYSLMYANACLKDYDMSGGHLPFFMNIIENPGITQDELTKLLRIDKSTTAKSIKALEKNGYVRREVCETDRRSYKLFPTEKAFEVREFVLKKSFDWDNKVLLSGFDDCEKERIYETLEKMADNAIKYFNREMD